MCSVLNGLVLLNVVLATWILAADNAVYVHCAILVDSLLEWLKFADVPDFHSALDYGSTIADPHFPLFI